MNTVLERLWRIVEANRTSTKETNHEDFLREFQIWEERLRKKMKVDEDFLWSDDKSQQNDNAQYDRFSNSRKQSYKDQTPSRDEKIAGYYANLELPYGANLEAVKKSYRRLMKEYHPDRFSNDAEKQKVATEITKGINHAFQELEKHLQSTVS